MISLNEFEELKTWYSQSQHFWPCLNVLFWGLEFVIEVIKHWFSWKPYSFSCSNGGLSINSPSAGYPVRLTKTDARWSPIPTTPPQNTFVSHHAFSRPSPNNTFSPKQPFLFLTNYIWSKISANQKPKETQKLWTAMDLDPSSPYLAQKWIRCWREKQ